MNHGKVHFVIMQQKLNEQIKVIGIQFSDVVIESISLPDDVEKLIDEQSGIGIAKGDMILILRKNIQGGLQCVHKDEKEHLQV